MKFNLCIMLMVCSISTYAHICYYYIVNKLDCCIKGLTVSFIVYNQATCLHGYLKLKINCSVLFMILQWGISGWISSGGCHWCDQCAGFSPFPRAGVWLHHVGLSMCDVIVASFFLFHLFLSYPWFTTTGTLALLLSDTLIGHMSLCWLPLHFHHHFILFCLWLLQLYACLTASSSTEFT